MRFSVGGSSSVTINGITYTGSNITIRGKKVVVDGVDQSGELLGDVSVVINGNCGNVETEGRITVNGDVTGDVTTSNAEIRCGNVGGDVTTSNSNVECGNVVGNVKTSNGDIIRR